MERRSRTTSSAAGASDKRGRRTGKLGGGRIASLSRCRGQAGRKLSQQKFNLAAKSNLTRRDAFHRRPENVIAEVPAVDADVEAVETDQHVESELLALPIKTIRYQRITQSPIRILSPNRLHLTSKGSTPSSKFRRWSRQRRTLRSVSCF